MNPVEFQVDKNVAGNEEQLFQRSSTQQEIPSQEHLSYGLGGAAVVYDIVNSY